MVGASAAWSTQIVRSEVAHHNRIIVEIGEQLDVPVFDFASTFPEEPDLWVDSVHMSERGARIKARQFADFLQARGLIPSVRP